MSNGWSLAGNAVATTDFLGTTNAQPLSVRTSGAERLRVQPDGKVGVGLADPRTPLHVLGGISTGLDFNSAGAVTFFPPDGFAWFHIDNGPAGGRPIGRLRISHGPNPGSQELMTLVQDGNVGIATSNPLVKLHITGDRIRLESAGKRLDLRADGGAVDIQSDTHNLFLHSSGPARNNHVIINPFGNEGNVGIGTGAPSDKLHVVGNVRANDVLLTSDVRLKTGIRPMRGAKRKLQKLRGVEFEWKESEGSALRRGAGVIAQEVESIAPELVQPERGDGYKGVNLGGMLGTFVEAFKELAAENEALRLRIEALERAGATVPTAGA
jgi:endosialidase-like protein